MVKWNNFEIDSETLFSSFFLTLFTSWSFEKNDLVHKFWDIILTEEWKGVLKCLLYTVQVHYDLFMTLDYHSTLNYFTKFKHENEEVQNTKDMDLKGFVNNLIFEDDVMDYLEEKFELIQEKSISFI